MSTDMTITTEPVVLTGELLTMDEDSKAVLSLAEVWHIDGPALYEAAVDEARRIKGIYGELDAKRKEMKAGALETCRQIEELFRLPLSRYRDSERKIKENLDAYDREQRRLAALEQKRLDADRAAKIREVEERARQEAKSMSAAEQKAFVKAAVEVEAPPMAVVPVTQTKVAGAAKKKSWKAVVIDPMALVKAIAAGHPQASIKLIKSFDQAALNALARSLGEQMSVPGVLAEEVSSVAIRRK